MGFLLDYEKRRSEKMERTRGVCNRRRGVRIVVGVLLLSSQTGVTAFCPSCRSPFTESSSLGARSGKGGEAMQRPNANLFGQLAATLPRWPSPRTKPKAKPRDWLTEKISSKMPEMSSSMPSNTVIGLLLFIVVIYTLSSNEPVPPMSGSEATAGQGFEILESSVESAGRNVLKAALPQTASDVVSVALGEGIAGVIGAIATLAVSLLLRVRAANKELMEGVIQKSDIVREAVADGDYFITRAAALPLFEALGLSPLAASVTSVILASVPYEIIKLGYSREAVRLEEDLIMEELLKEEQKRKRQSNGPTRSIAQSVDPRSLIPANDVQQIDFVELFTDITKWLEYDVLKTDLSGRLVWNGHVLASNLDSALFGFFAALSSQLYADIAYRYTDYGTEEKRKEARERSLGDWIKLYTTISINSAVLFGVYETVKSPVANAIAGFLSGGVENCLGSKEYSTCMDVYMVNNPPAADAAAQFRSLITAVVSLWDRIQNDGSLDKAEFTRSLVVQLYSLAHQIFSFSLFSGEVGVPGEYLTI
jgi:hypothetical protein